jgi:hypothetical protein
MQVNAGIHRARSVLAYLQRYHINTITWPAYSPDLNPIEHLWWQLKKRMYEVLGSNGGDGTRGLGAETYETQLYVSLLLT